MLGIGPSIFHNFKANNVSNVTCSGPLVSSLSNQWAWNEIFGQVVMEMLLKGTNKGCYYSYSYGRGTHTHAGYSGACCS